MADVRLRVARDCYCDGIGCFASPFCNRGIDLANERLDHASAESMRLRDDSAFGDRAITLVGNAY